jgi:hypothetical protein
MNQVGDVVDLVMLGEMKNDETLHMGLPVASCNHKGGKRKDSAAVGVGAHGVAREQ